MIRCFILRNWRPNFVYLYVLSFEFSGKSKFCRHDRWERGVLSGEMFLLWNKKAKIEGRGYLGIPKPSQTFQLIRRLYVSHSRKNLSKHSGFPRQNQVWIHSSLFPVYSIPEFSTSRHSWHLQRAACWFQSQSTSWVFLQAALSNLPRDRRRSFCWMFSGPPCTVWKGRGLLPLKPRSWRYSSCL